jgi:hypothetical protein
MGMYGVTILVKARSQCEIEHRHKEHLLLDEFLYLLFCLHIYTILAAYIVAMLLQHMIYISSTCSGSKQAPGVPTVTNTKCTS